MRWLMSLQLAIAVLCSCGGDDDAPPPDAAADAFMCEQATDCDDGVFCNGEESCQDGACVPGEGPCIDGQTCNEDDERCVTGCANPDADGDGVDSMDCGGADCDDSDANRYPGAAEVCDPDGVDEDCDPTTLGGEDVDGDGFISSACCNGDTCGDDCDDTRRFVAPGAAEICDRLDGDCDGSVDEGRLVPGYADEDGDRRGNSERPIMGCPATDRFSFVGDDCDDSDPATPGDELLGDGNDNDCDGLIDEGEGTARTMWPDTDGDGYGDVEGVTIEGSVAIDGYSPISGDCDDADVLVHPGALERCNGIDDDCDGVADARTEAGDGEDDDGDGFPDAACEPDGPADCDDNNPAVYPSAPEICDGVSNDCDAETPADQNCADVTWYLDQDGDGFGDDGSTMTASAPLVGYAIRGGDCDDSNSEVRPDAYETCNGVDDNCDGVTDERADLLCGGTNALGVCEAGSCAQSQCATGYGDCDAEPSDCELLLDQLSHCGGCDTVCSAGTNTIPSCVGFECQYECAPGFDDCNDELFTDGCEINLMVDVGNCGECARACRDAEDTVAACEMGECTLECADGYDDCNDDLDMTGGDYCETPTSADPENCGGCDNICEPFEPLCSGGMCETWNLLSDGSSGTFTFMAQTGSTMTLDSGIYQYTGDVVIPAAMTLHASGTGVLEIRTTGDIIVDGTIDLSGGNGGGLVAAPGNSFCANGGSTGTAIDGVIGGGIAGGGIGGPGYSGGNEPDAAVNCGWGGEFGGGTPSMRGGGGGGGPAGGGGGGRATALGGSGGGPGGGTAGDGVAGGGGGTTSLAQYRGGDGAFGTCGGGGGGSIGDDAVADLEVETTLVPGSGGGAGCGGLINGSGAGGGGGGGALRLTTLGAIRISGTGAILARGGDGGSAHSGHGCGGGGSGGVIYLAAPEIQSTGTIDATGGLGGSDAACADGGDGGPGRIRLSVDPARCSLATVMPTTSCNAAPAQAGAGYTAAFPE